MSRGVSGFLTDLRWIEAFDAFKYVNFFPPNMSVVSPKFGTLQTADRPRVIQLALLLTF